MHLARREKHFFVGACVIACLLGAFAGYIALWDELEHQFHGGVLDEDVSRVMWNNIWTTAFAFAKVTLITVVVIGVAPIGLRRLLAQGAREG